MSAQQGDGADSAKLFVNLDEPQNSDALATGDDMGGPPPPPPPPPVAGVGKGKNAGLGQALVVGLVALLGGGTVYGMRTVAMHSGVTSSASDMSYEPVATSPDFRKRYDVAMTGLARSNRALHVPRDLLDSRPFTLDATQDIVAAPGENLEELEARRRALLEAERTERERAARFELIAREADLLELQAVLGGRSPVARVSGRTVREGDELAELFTVTHIDARSVVIEADGRQFELRLGRRAIELRDQPVEE
ncbi:MAG: hypothetical protein AAFP26_07190 [Planctomycetota bacterium]